MTNIKPLIITLLFAWCIPNTAQSATFTIKKFHPADLSMVKVAPIEKKCYDEIKISGDILDNDAQSFIKKINELRNINKNLGCLSDNKLRATISLESNGGSVSEAMKIGRIIRENEFRTSIYYNENCASSCVLIFASGIYRMSGGNIQIHRPYFTHLNPSLSRQQVQEMRIKVMEEMKRFAMEMDFSEALIDHMISIPPEQMHTLTLDEAKKYRLDGRDASSEEKQVAENAALFGFSSIEYRQRRAEADARCDVMMDEYGECHTAAILRISMAEYKKRFEKLRLQCHKTKPVSRQCIKDVLVDGK
jgi:hypothetical protein